MSERTKEWRDGLDESQQATVEKAAIGSFNCFPPITSSWAETSESLRGMYCRAQVHALREIGVLPQPPKRTRGEEVAEKMVEHRRDYHDVLLDGFGLLIRETSHAYEDSIVEGVRGAIAAAIDAERDDALEAAAVKAIEYMEKQGAHAGYVAGISEAIRGLKSGGGK